MNLYTKRTPTAICEPAGILIKTYQLLKRGEKKRINISCFQYHYYFLQKGYYVWVYVLKKTKNPYFA